MMIIKFLFIATGFCVPSIVADTPKAKVRYLEYTIITAPDNPYYDPWIPEILPSRDAVNIKTPIKKDVPAEMRVKSVLKNDGDIIMSEDMTLCEFADKYDFATAIKDNVVPKDKYPLMCPFTTCLECEVVNMKALTEKLPPGLPAAVLDLRMIVYLDNENAPFLDSNVKAELYYE